MNPSLKEVRVIRHTGTSKTFEGKFEEEAFVSGANRIRIGSGIDRRDNLGNLPQAGGSRSKRLSLEERVWSDVTFGDTQTQAT